MRFPLLPPLSFPLAFLYLRLPLFSSIFSFLFGLLCVEIHPPFYLVWLGLSKQVTKLE